MLIRKGNFLKFKLCMASLGLLLACACACSGAAQAAPRLTARPASHAGPNPAARAAPRTADIVAAEFYGWYLDTLSADQDPLSDRYDTFIRYVAKDLAGGLVERLRRGRLPDSDYFIQSADYRRGWLRSVHAQLVRQRAGTAEVQVTLGKQGRTARVVLLSMVLENGGWKIRTVALAGGSSLKSSAEQPVI